MTQSCITFNSNLEVSPGTLSGNFGLLNCFGFDLGNLSTSSVFLVDGHHAQVSHQINEPQLRSDPKEKQGRQEATGPTQYRNNYPQALLAIVQSREPSGGASQLNGLSLQLLTLS